MARAAAVLVLVLLLAGCGSHRAVAVHVTPGNSVEDQPIHIVVDGLQPHQVVALRLRSTDTKGVAFGAKATFAADAHGIVDVDHASAHTGSAYSGVWPMGLLTSMSAPSAPPFTPYFWGKTPQRFTLTASVAGRAVASTTFRRSLPNGRFTVEDETVPKDGFDGFYYAPAGASRRPAVLMFGGSEGGVGRSLLGALLAAHGVPALDIGYFHAPGLPSALKNIPLEYFRGALEWLDRQPQVDSSRVSVLGVSRGSEAALLLGVHYPKLVHGVVALVPSDVSLCGTNVFGRSGCIGAAWTFEGKPIPYTKQIDLPHPWDNPNAVIPVQRIRAPVLLACGGRDQVWSSCPYSAAIVARMKAHGKSGQVELYRYPTAGHYIGGEVVYEPGSLASDFFVPDDERAREQLWPHVLAFLEKN